MNNENLKNLFGNIAHKYDSTNQILSIGMVTHWYRKLIKEVAPNATSTLDVATGTGKVAGKIKKKRKELSVTGIDITPEMLEIAKESHKNIKFRLMNGQKLDFSEDSFDFVSLSFGLRNFSVPAKGLQEAHRVLRTGGKFAVLEFSIPQNKMVKRCYIFYLRKLLPFIGSAFTSNPESYRYLSESIETFSKVDLVKSFEKMEFKNVTKTPLTFGIATLYTGIK